MYAEISAAIQSAKSLSELLKAAHSLSNYNEFAAAVSEINMKLMDATAVALKSQEKQAELQAMVAGLESRLEDARRQLDRAKDYRLHKFETNALAYEFVGDTSQVPAHFACASCFDKGMHSKLQPQGNYGMKCHSCDSSIQTKFTPAPKSQAAGSKGFARDW